ncbi:hypothetical protein [Metabacillus sp. 84]|uniref:hypothetical protein n=1 Tax=Metabacillus sp. 84 TaxID=3404705 RepID=UPI003CF32D2E
MSIELALIPIAIAAVQGIGTAMEKKMDSKSYSLTTIMKDEAILAKALDHYGCSPKFMDHKGMESEIGDIKILFQQNPDGIFEALFEQDIPQETALEFIKNLQEEYTSIVQQETYLKLLERAREQGLLLETEQVTEDNSIVLTFKVN